MDCIDMHGSSIGGAELVLRGGRRVPLLCSAHVPLQERHAWHQQVVAHVNCFLERSLGRDVLVESDARPSALVLPNFCDWSYEQRAAYADARRVALSTAVQGGAAQACLDDNSHGGPAVSVEQRPDASQARLAATRTTAAALLSQLCPRHPLHRERRAGAFLLRRPARGAGVYAPHGCTLCREAVPGTANTRLRAPAPWWAQNVLWPAMQCWLLAHMAALLAISWFAPTSGAASTKNGIFVALRGNIVLVPAWIVIPGRVGPYLVLDDASGKHARWRVEARPGPLAGLLRKPRVLASGTAAQARHAAVRGPAGMFALLTEARAPHRAGHRLVLQQTSSCQHTSFTFKASALGCQNSEVQVVASVAKPFATQSNGAVCTYRW